MGIEEMSQMIQSKSYIRDKVRFSKDNRGEVRMVIARKMKTMGTIKIVKTKVKNSLVICDILKIC